MELRNRVTGITKKAARGLDVALGPTIYNGERYSKMSERIKRQHMKPCEVAEANTQRVIAFVVALVFVLSLVSTMMYQAHVRRSNRMPFDV
ncbi:unnamed protein product [Peronospora farinosa]|uniref:Uncharacterized protein n=1 Tax=Peronospora farinosa TaxID=134698 RepID=A0AAV0THE4_9STRA|nr:unnamed protein product [Peronospora farinosa]CAI5720358.1 unnamed protein product [Peronospora farinosa]